MKNVIGTTALIACALVLLPFSADAQVSGTSRIQQERMEVGRALMEVQSTNWPSVLPYYTDDIEYHDPIVDIYGIDMMTEFLGRMFASTPDLVTTIEDETLNGNIYTATWTMLGQFNGSPYTAKGISIVKFLPGRTQVYYQRDYYTENDIMINIPGLDQAAIGFRTYYRCAVDPTYECPLGGAASGVPTGIMPTDDTLNEDKSGSLVRPAASLRRERLEIGRALVEINGADWPSLLPYYTDDIEYRDPIVAIYGIETMVPFLARLFGNSADLITTVEDESLDGDIYTATWTMAGQFNGFPYSAHGMSILKFREGTTQAYFSRDYYSEGDIMITIPGLDQAVVAFRTYYKCAVDPTFDCPVGKSGAPGDLEIAANGSGAPRSAFSLQQNAPNPFNPSTQISFVVPDGGANVSLRIYDITGRLVRTLVEGHEPAGTRSVTWYGDNSQGQPVASGTYFYQLTAPSYSEKKMMVLLK